ncbi:MAG TPA: PQQ-binding-like beta-propeller repeat protein [Candidatus Limnocylindrales bacterium]|nr:PQQ-binding-like beta-propeller repeat protein [Candidatus Limnocylindrales bacterium]
MAVGHHDGPGHIAARLSAPTIAGDAIYVLAGDGGVIALDRATGEVRWEAPIPNGIGTNVPSVADGLVYVGGEGFVAALNAADGVLVWQADIDAAGPIGVVVVADGVAYAGDGAPGGLHAFDARTGVELWTVEEPLFAPAVAGSIAVAGSPSGRVLGVDTATGGERWRYQMSGASRPASTADGVAYIASETGRRVFALDVATGEKLWHFDIDGDVMCCVGVGSGLVIVPTMSGSLYAIAGDGQAIEPKP